MRPILLRVFGSLAVGVVCFLVVGAAATVGFVRWIELSLMLGIPMGLTAGLTGLVATYVVLEYRTARTAGTVTDPIVGRLWTGLAAVVAYVLATLVGLGLFFLGDGDDGVFVLLFGLPVAVLGGALLAYVTARVTRRARPRPPAPPESHG